MGPAAIDSAPHPSHPQVVIRDESMVAAAEAMSVAAPVAIQESASPLVPRAVHKLVTIGDDAD